jgi:hypothetical protein
MTVRETSIAAFNTIKENGLLSRVRFQVYEALVTATDNGHAPSAAELYYFMRDQKRNPTHSNITTRLGELRDMGVAREAGKKKCPVTGTTVIAWRAVDALPRRLLKPKKARAHIARVRAT